MDSLVGSHLPEKLRFTPIPQQTKKPKKSTQKPTLIPKSNSTFSYLDLIYYFLVVFSIPVVASYILRYFN